MHTKLQSQGCSRWKLRFPFVASLPGRRTTHLHLKLKMCYSKRWRPPDSADNVAPNRPGSGHPSGKITHFRPIPCCLSASASWVVGRRYRLPLFLQVFSPFDRAYTDTERSHSLSSKCRSVLHFLAPCGKLEYPARTQLTKAMITCSNEAESRMQSKIEGRG